MNNNYNFINELLALEKLTNIHIFKKKILENYKMRNNENVINDCNKMKKKQLIILAGEIKTIANNNITIDKIKYIYEKTLDNIDNLNKIINIVNYTKTQFIEEYSN
jgi:hypothetical protein